MQHTEGVTRLERARNYWLGATFVGAILLAVIVFVGPSLLHEPSLDVVYLIIGAATLLSSTAFMATSFRLGRSRARPQPLVDRARPPQASRLVKMSLGAVAVAGNVGALLVAGRTSILGWVLGALVAGAILLVIYRDRKSGSS